MAGAFPGKKGTCCNFALNRIPADARIPVVITRGDRSSGRKSAPTTSGEISKGQSRLTSAATIIVPPEEVRVKERGWTLDFLNVVAAVCDRRKSSGAHRAPLQDWKEFTTADVYTFTRELEKLHPDNSESFREQAAMSATKFISPRRGDIF